eukprot:3436761-Amphidinium_carterae.1
MHLATWSFCTLSRRSHLNSTLTRGARTHPPPPVARCTSTSPIARKHTFLHAVHPLQTLRCISKEWNGPLSLLQSALSMTILPRSVAFDWLAWPRKKYANAFLTRNCQATEP